MYQATIKTEKRKFVGIGDSRRQAKFNAMRLIEKPNPNISSVTKKINRD